MKLVEIVGEIEAEKEKHMMDLNSEQSTKITYIAYGAKVIQITMHKHIQLTTNSTLHKFLKTTTNYINF